VIVPVTGLPPQVTDQSTPARLLSPTGIIARFADPPTIRAVTGPLATAEDAMTGPAFGLDLAPLPQPEIPVPIKKTRNMELQRATSAGNLSAPATGLKEEDFIGTDRANIENMAVRFLLLSVQDGSFLRLSE
jgi:hypothetical protein